MLLLVATTALTSATLSATAFGSVLPSDASTTWSSPRIVGPLAVAIVVRRQQADRVDW